MAEPFYNILCGAFWLFESKAENSRGGMWFQNGI
jgi:hypothetical protein